MQISYHASERFLQRVFQLTSYTQREIQNAMQLLGRDLYNLQLCNTSRITLPSFPQFYGVIKENTLITVIPKRLKG